MSREPDYNFRYAAWKVKLPEPPLETAHQAALAAWLLYVPKVNAFWDWYYVGLVHLRDVPGAAPAHKQYPEAEHEILIFAVNPEHTPDPDHPEEGYKFLEPANLVFQFDSLADQDACRLTEVFVKAMAFGKVWPDTDHHELQVKLLEGTIKHMRQGRHPTSKNQ